MTGDGYSAEWVAATWKTDCGIPYKLSEMHKSDLMREGLPLFMRYSLRIPPHQILIRELRLLERRTLPGDLEQIGHPRGSREHDDHANALFGALYCVAGRHVWAAPTLPTIILLAVTSFERTSAAAPFQCGRAIPPRERYGPENGALRPQIYVLFLRYRAALKKRDVRDPVLADSKLMREIYCEGRGGCPFVAQ